MRKLLSIFCLLCLFAVPMVLTGCESPQEDALEDDAAVETTFEEGAIEVDGTMETGTGMDMGTDMDMDTDMDMGTDMDDDMMDEPPAE